MTAAISAYIPCFNNRDTLAASISGIREQTKRVDDLYVVDDGSTDDSVEICKSLGVRVIRQPANLGRGATRALAMLEANHELVLCCDATNSLPPAFLERSLPWFQAPAVAAVFGRITQAACGDTVHRWRGRHLFRVSSPSVVSEHGLLATYGAIVRKPFVMAVGNYDRRLRHTEDANLGRRLLGCGYKVVFDPSLEAVSIAKNSLWQVMERYWRWYAGVEENQSVANYAKLVWYSMRSMALMDLKERDYSAIGISLLAPHYQFWRSAVRKTHGKLRTERNPIFCERG